MRRFAAIGLLTLAGFFSTYAWADENLQESQVQTDQVPRGVDSERQRFLEELNRVNLPLREIQLHIQHRYYREVDMAKCVEQILVGGLAKCTDPNSSYISPDEIALSASEVSGTFFGIGAELSIDKEGRIVVVSPMDGSPALRAGIVPGDIITHVGDSEDKLVSIKDKSLHEIVKIIRGPKGTAVVIRVLRRGEEKTFKIIRDEIVSVSVEAKDLGGRFGYVRVRQFQERTDDVFRDALLDLRSKNSCGAVLDFRNNPGGLLSVALEMTDLFSQKVGDIFIVQKFRTGENAISVLEPLGDLRNFLIVTLVNGGSASASELFAGIMQEWGHPVVGTKTYGKGTVQELIPLQNGGILRLTIAEYFIGNARKKINEVGVTPDHVVENPELKLPEDPLERFELLKKVDPENDPQLKKAVEVLKSRASSCLSPK